jgi:hypothetical protein
MLNIARAAARRRLSSRSTYALKEYLTSNRAVLLHHNSSRSIGSFFPSFYNHSWLTKNLPKGFEDFFPENAKRKPEELGEKKKNSEKPDDESAFTQSSSSSDEQKQQKSGGGGSEKPPPGDDTANLPGLIALLAAIVTLRSWLDQDEDIGQEITWVDFRNKFLETGKVEKLQVINRKMARVILRSNTGDPSVAAIGGESTFDDGDMSFEEDASSQESGATMANSKRKKDARSNEFYFYVSYYYCASLEYLSNIIFLFYRLEASSRWKTS